MSVVVININGKHEDGIVICSYVVLLVHYGGQANHFDYTNL
jgi:hypothetical protein